MDVQYAYYEYLEFITDFKRLTFVREVLNRFHFNEINLATAKGIQTFIDNLTTLKDDLISAKINEEEILVMIEFLKGAHPRGGQVKKIHGDWVKFECGWKIHLHVRPINQKVVYTWLVRNCTDGWKYLGGGEDGKDFTIYIGSWDRTEQVSVVLMQQLGNYLENPVGDILKMDLKAHGKIWARFESPKSLIFRGHRILFSSRESKCGLTFSDADFDKFFHNKQNTDKDLANYLGRSYAFLNEFFGVYFRGSRNQVGTRITWWINYLSGVPPGPENF